MNIDGELSVLGALILDIIFLSASILMQIKQCVNNTVFIL